MGCVGEHLLISLHPCGPRALKASTIMQHRMKRPPQMDDVSTSPKFGASVGGRTLQDVSIDELLRAASCALFIVQAFQQFCDSRFSRVRVFSAGGAHGKCMALGRTGNCSSLAV